MALNLFTPLPPHARPVDCLPPCTGHHSTDAVMDTSQLDRLIEAERLLGTCPAELRALVRIRANRGH